MSSTSTCQYTQACLYVGIGIGIGIGVGIGVGIGIGVGPDHPPFRFTIIFSPSRVTPKQLPVDSEEAFKFELLQME